MAAIQRHLPIIIIVLLLILLGLGVFGFVKTRQSVPSRDFVILVDEQGGGYDEIGQLYRQLFRLREVDLTIRPTAGAQEALQLLEQGEASMALIPGYLTRDANRAALASLGALSHEPLWIFYNPGAFGGQPLTLLSQLKQKRIAIGPPDGKTYPLATQLLSDSGVTAENSTLLELPAPFAVDQLIGGDIDALMVLDVFQADAVQRLLQEPGVELASLARADAYAARQRALATVTLPAGIVDLSQGIPPEDKTLLASATNLVIRRDLNPTVSRSMIIASLLLNSEGDYFSKPFSFPNLEASDLPVLPEYASFFNRVKGGGFTLEANTPFWVAHTVERLIFFLIPVGLLLLLLIAYAPALWRWHMRGKVLPYYKQLRKIEAEIPDANPQQIDAALDELAMIDAELARRVRVSMGYLPELYQLRVHVHYVMDELVRTRDQLPARASQSPESV